MYPLFLSASWYGVAASLKTSSSENIYETLLFTDSGMFFLMLGGWFHLLCTYSGVFVGFEFGLNLPVFSSKATSRKLTRFLFPSIVIFSSFLTNILQISFSVLSDSLGV